MTPTDLPPVAPPGLEFLLTPPPPPPPGWLPLLAEVVQAVAAWLGL